MIRPLIVGFLLVLAGLQIGFASSAIPQEEFLRALPPGLFLKGSHEVSEKAAASIGQKLDGDVERITNSIVQIHGRPIQINAVTAVDEAGARAIYMKIAAAKPYPYSVRRNRTVVEYVGPRIDEAIATKTSFELGLIEKPKQVRYRVTAKLALIEKADYMACNSLFQQFDAMDSEDDARSAGIARLANKFVFGKSLTLRNPRFHPAPAKHRCAPSSSSVIESGATVSYSFDNPPKRAGVPYVTVNLDVTVNDTGLCQTIISPGPTLTSPTSHWPVDDPQVQALARQITKDMQSNEAKVIAILRWLAPGKNIRTAGQTGSRWGTTKVLEQRFGHCWDFSDCFVTLARAAGVPCRQVAGWVYGSCGHVWAEYYHAGMGWQQVDPTGGGSFPCGIYHIPYFTSEDGEMPIVYVSTPEIELVN